MKFFSKLKEARNEMSRKWSLLMHDRSFVVSLIIGAILLFGGQIATIMAAAYKDQMFKGVTVGDLLLDVLPTVDLGFMFTWGMMIMMLIITFYAILVRPELCPWALKTYGIFGLVRAAFMLFTHLAPPEGMFYLTNAVTLEEKEMFQHYFFLNDLFFSGHVGNAFLAVLIFRNYKFKWFCLIGSVLMSITVLFMKVHYTIDVLGAYFITYGIYAFSDWIFHKYNERFRRIIWLGKHVTPPFHPEVPAR